MIERRAAQRRSGTDRRGRPREFDSMISVRLTRPLHDALCREALARQMDLADVIRERLAVSQKSPSA